MDTEVFSWIQQWYLEHCDGDWEHQYGIRMETLDNPGWSVTVDLVGTELEGLSFSVIDINRSEENWIYCRVEGDQFKAACGPLNLTEVLNLFRQWAADSSKTFQG